MSFPAKMFGLGNCFFHLAETRIVLYCFSWQLLDVDILGIKNVWIRCAWIYCSANEKATTM